MSQLVNVYFLTAKDLVLKLTDDLVNVKLVIVVELVIAILIEFNKPVIHLVDISFKILRTARSVCTLVLSVPSDKICIQPNLELRELLFDLFHVSVTFLLDLLTQPLEPLVPLLGSEYSHCVCNGKHLLCIDI